MSRKLLAQLAIGSIGLVGLLATTTSFADPLTVVYVATTTSLQKVQGSKPTVTVAPSPTRQHPEVSFSLTPNVLDSRAQSLTFAPAWYSGCNRECDPLNTAESNVTVTFELSLSSNFDDAVTVSDTGTFMADYSNDMDSIEWKGASNSSFCTPYTDDGTTTTDCAVLATTLSNGDLVDVVLNNAADWDIKSYVSFEVTPPTVPEPSSIALLLAGVLGLGLAWRFGFGKRLPKDRV